MTTKVPRHEEVTAADKEQREAVEHEKDGQGEHLPVQRSREVVDAVFSSSPEVVEFLQSGDKERWNGGDEVQAPNRSNDRQSFLQCPAKEAEVFQIGLCVDSHSMA